MISRERLLQAIIDQPDDDAPRLVYSDWLEERGEAEQANYIRASVEIAKLDPASPRAVKLREDLPANPERWLEDWGISVEVDELLFEFRRGFPERIDCLGPSAFFDNAKRIFQSVPVQIIVLDHWPTEDLNDDHLLELAAMPELNRIRSLSLSQHDCASEAWVAFFRSRHLGTLRQLNISGNTFDDGDVDSLLDSPSLSNLTWLDLSFNYITLDGFRRLLDAPSMRKLETLYIARNRRLLDDSNVGEDDASDVVRDLRHRFGADILDRLPDRAFGD